MFHFLKNNFAYEEILGDDEYYDTTRGWKRNRTSSEGQEGWEGELGNGKNYKKNNRKLRDDKFNRITIEMYREHQCI